MTEQPLTFHPQRPCLHAGEHIGRDLLVQSAFDRLATENVQSLAVIGFNRSGKTSFVNHLRQPETMQRYLGERSAEFLFIYLDAAQLNLDSEEIFFKYLYQAIAKQTPLQGLQGVRDLLRVNQWLREQSKRLVCIFDNFNLIVSHPNYRIQFYDALRAWFYDEDRVGCVLTSPVQLDQLSMSKELASSPFINIFTTYTLNNLKLTEATILLESRLPNVLKDKEKAIFQVIEQIGSHPYLLQLAGKGWVDHYQTHKQTGFSDALEDVYQSCQPYYEEIYASLKTRQLQAIAELLQSGKAATDNHLINRGILDKDGLAISARLFERFLRQRLGMNKSYSINPMAAFWQWLMAKR